jgi:Tfp pilus assembly PilM family ATPase
MRDLAIYTEYKKLLGLNWKESKRILKQIYEAMDEQSFKNIEEFRQCLTDEERRVFNCYSSPESTYIRECVRFLAGED